MINDGSIRNVDLVPATILHAQLWFEWRHEPDLVRYCPVLALPLESVRGRLERCGSDLTDESFSEYRWMIRANEEHLVGTVSLIVNWQMRYAELGYQVADAWSRRGIGRRGVALAVDEAFTASRIERIYAFVSEDNAPSIALAERLGLQREGALRGHYFIQGRRITQYLYGILRDEWNR